MFCPSVFIIAILQCPLFFSCEFFLNVYNFSVLFSNEKQFHPVFYPISRSLVHNICMSQNTIN